MHYTTYSNRPRGRIAYWVTFLNQFTFTVKHVQGSKNVVLHTLSRCDYANMPMDADDAIDVYPVLGCLGSPNGIILMG